MVEAPFTTVLPQWTPEARIPLQSARQGLPGESLLWTRRHHLECASYFIEAQDLLAASEPPKVAVRSPPPSRGRQGSLRILGIILRRLFEGRGTLHDHTTGRDECGLR
jgi:hypothetical protein